MRFKTGNTQTSDQGVLEIIPSGGLAASLSENAVGELDLTLSGSGLGGSTTLATDVAAGANTALLSFADGIAVGQLAAFGVGTSTCEVRRITAIIGTTVTLSVALKWSHTTGQSVRFPNYWVPALWWGCVPDSTVDSFRNLSNMLLDQQAAGTIYGILGLGEILPFYSSRPLWVPDKHVSDQLALSAYSSFGFDCTLGIWNGYDNQPHQHFFHVAGQNVTVTGVDTALDQITLSGSIGAVEGEPVAFYVREGLGTLPGGLTEGRTYYVKTTAGSTYTLSIDKWGASTVDLTSAHTGEVVAVSPGNSRIIARRLFLDGGGRSSQIRGLNGFYAFLQQQSNLTDFRAQGFAGVAVTCNGQQSEWINPMITGNRIGFRFCGGRFVYIHGGNFEVNDTNMEFADMATDSPSGTAVGSASNRNDCIYGSHFETSGIGTRLIWTIKITGVPAAGTFGLVYSGNTQTLNWNATAGDVQTACDNLFGAGNTLVTGGALPGAQITITFQGAYLYGFGPTTSGSFGFTITNAITGGSYSLSSVKPEGRQISLKGSLGTLITGVIDAGQANPVTGLGHDFLTVEGAAASAIQHGGYTLAAISSTGSTGNFVTDPLRLNVSRVDSVAGGASGNLAYWSAPDRHAGSSVGRNWWLVGDSGKYAAFGGAGAAIWEIVGAASATAAEKLMRLKLGATPNASAYAWEVADSADATLAYCDTKGLVAPPATRPKVATPTYSTSITPDASAAEWQTITVTDAVAFTINAPTSPPTAAQSQNLTIEVFNSSGGAMGAITWNAAFVFAGLAWTNPASTKKRYVTFRWNGTKWVAAAVAAGDY